MSIEPGGGTPPPLDADPYRRIEAPLVVVISGPSGVGKDIKLYTVFSVDNATLPAIGDAAVGTQEVESVAVGLAALADRLGILGHVELNGNVK